MLLPVVVVEYHTTITNRSVVLVWLVIKKMVRPIVVVEFRITQPDRHVALVQLVLEKGGFTIVVVKYHIIQLNRFVVVVSLGFKKNMVLLGVVVPTRIMTAAMYVVIIGLYSLEKVRVPPVVLAKLITL